MSRLRSGPMHASFIDPDWLEHSTIEDGVVGVDVCSYCGRANVAINGDFRSSACFLGHQEAPLVHYVAIRADLVSDLLPEKWAEGLIEWRTA